MANVLKYLGQMYYLRFNHLMRASKLGSQMMKVGAGIKIIIAPWEMDEFAVLYPTQPARER